MSKSLSRVTHDDIYYQNVSSCLNFLLVEIRSILSSFLFLFFVFNLPYYESVCISIEEPLVYLHLIYHERTMERLKAYFFKPRSFGRGQ